MPSAGSLDGYRRERRPHCRMKVHQGSLDENGRVEINNNKNNNDLNNNVQHQMIYPLRRRAGKPDNISPSGELSLRE